MSWRLVNRRSKDSLVTLSVVIMQIFHEKINKLRIFMWKKKKKSGPGTSRQAALFPLWRAPPPPGGVGGPQGGKEGCPAWMNT